MKELNARAFTPKHQTPSSRYTAPARLPNYVLRMAGIIIILLKKRYQQRICKNAARSVLL